MHIHTTITAHSGCEGRPDNSLEYVRFALGCGADALEVDVRRRSGGLYISHDPSAGFCPSLREVFELAQGSGMTLNCDLKEPGLEWEVLDLARACGVEVVFSGTVSAGLLAEAEIRDRTLWNPDNAVHDFWERVKKGGSLTAEDIRLVAERCRERGAKAVNVYYGFCSPENLAIFRERGVGVSAWTVDEEGEARRLLEAGVCNITSRRPLMVLSLRGEKGRG